jgi:hypothetical protein
MRGVPGNAWSRFSNSHGTWAAPEYGRRVTPSYDRPASRYQTPSYARRGNAADGREYGDRRDR